MTKKNSNQKQQVDEAPSKWVIRVAMIAALIGGAIGGNYFGWIGAVILGVILAVLVGGILAGLSAVWKKNNKTENAIRIKAAAPKKGPLEGLTQKEKIMKVAKPWIILAIIALIILIMSLMLR